MKNLELSEDERRTLREMGIFHPYPRSRMRAQGILRLSQGLALRQTAYKFGVHSNSVEQWRQRWGNLVWSGSTKGVTRAGRGSGRPSSNMRLESWRIPRGYG